jgi:hypothetical protein
LLSKHLAAHAGQAQYRVVAGILAKLLFQLLQPLLAAVK